MSARIKTFMPLLDEDSILVALSNLGETFEVQGNQIIINSKCVYWKALLVKMPDGRFIIEGDSEYVGNTFQKKLIKEYEKVYNEKVLRIQHEELIRKERLRQEAEEVERRLLEQERICLEQERRRLDEERRRYIESKKQKIYERAEKLGYTVKETEKNENIKLVLVKRIY